MNELALFAGAGGGILGGKLLGWRTVCAVEIDAYARSVLIARQRDSILEPFPIWDDIRTFDGRPWRGVDVLSGGFPCQPFSSAARGRNNACDLWPEMLRVVMEAEPKWVFAENVKHKPILCAASDLHRLGYACAFAELAASRVGAPHHRSRWWLVGHSYKDRQPRQPLDAEVALDAGSHDSDWWENHPGSLGMDDGMADRMDRLGALGNGQVPAVAALAFNVLKSRLV